MAQSSYLTDALRSMSATPQPMAMPAMPGGADRYRSRRVGRSNITDALRQAGQNIQGTPGRVASLFGGGQAGPMPAQAGMGMGKTVAAQPPSPLSGNPDDPRNLPLDRVSIQPSALTNGNALPAYTLPSWASDSGDDPEGLASKRTYFNVPEQMSPFLKPNQWGVLPGTNLTAEDYAAIGRGETIPAQVETQRQIARMMGGGPLAGTQPMDQPQAVPQAPIQQPAPAPSPLSGHGLDLSQIASSYVQQPGPPAGGPSMGQLMGGKGGSGFMQAFGQGQPQPPPVPQFQPPSEMELANFFQNFGY